MASSSDHNTNILRNTPGLTNLFRSNVRRSRSLASLQREANIDPFIRSRTPGAGMLGNVSQEQAGMRPPLKTAKTMNSPEGHRAIGITLQQQGQQQVRPWFANQSVFNQQNTRTPSPPSRPKPAPRLWTEDDDEPDIKPSLLAMQSGPVRASPQQMRQPPMSSNGPTSYQRDPRSQSPLGQSIQASRERSLSRRRKPSVAELSLDPLTTVTEWSQESPVVQRRTTRNLSDPSPRHPESSNAMSARELSAQRTPRAGSHDDTARTPQPTDARFLTPSGASSSTLTPQAAKRASSMLLPIALAPLITSSPPQITTHNLLSPEGDKPPVPPKEPGYKATPQKSSTPRPPPPAPSASVSTVSSVSHSAKSSISEAEWSVSSSVTTMSPIEMPVTWPMDFPSREDTVSPTSHHTEEEQSMPWAMKEFKAMPQRKPVGSPPRVEEVTRFPTLSPPTNHHQRNVSDSVLNRGRPTKRGNQHRPQRTISRDLKLANIAGTIDDLPEGYDKVQALTTFSQQELCCMRREADCEASGFVAVDAKDAADLRKELELLENHCGELRRRTLSLRESRTQLHERMLGYLRAPGNQLVSREHVLKQHTELTELDVKIDEAATKLEAAQDRRAKVQRKLLEHTAAVLALKLPAMGSAAEEQTPPRSPEEAEDADAAPQPSSIVISIASSSPAASPAALQADEAQKLQAEEHAYLERIQREREAEERREREQREDAERQSQELQAELQRQQAERKASASASASEATAEPEDKSDAPSPSPPTTTVTSPQLLLSQDVYRPPTRSTSLKHLTSMLSPAAAGMVSPAATKQPSPREEITQSIQIYADEDIYEQHEGGIDSLLSSIEQEIDAIDRSRATSVY